MRQSGPGVFPHLIHFCRSSAPLTYVPQCLSPLPSRQSLCPSHRHSEGTQMPLSQRKSPAVHSARGTPPRQRLARVSTAEAEGLHTHSCWSSRARRCRRGTRPFRRRPTSAGSSRTRPGTGTGPCRTLRPGHTTCSPPSVASRIFVAPTPFSVKVTDRC